MNNIFDLKYRLNVKQLLRIYTPFYSRMIILFKELLDSGGK